MNGNDLKPGVQTTELWFGTVLPQVIGLIVLFGWVKPGDAHSLEDAIKQIVVATSVVVTNGIVVYKYIHSRWLLKSQNLANSSNVDRITIPQIGGK